MRVTQTKRTLHRCFPVVSVVLAALFIWGCAASRTTVVKPPGTVVPPQTATKQDLIARYNRQAGAVTSLNAAVKMTLTAGSAYTGIIKQYHEVNGFILAQGPSSIRVIGQAPIVGTNIFDMVSDGQTFQVFIPSQNRFITGPVNLERPSAKPIENLRPQHLIGAIFWDAIPEHSPVLIEEANEAASQYYVLTVVRASGNSAPQGPEAPADWEIAQKIWFVRSDLNVARIETYDAGGKMGSDIWYSGWSASGAIDYPRKISLGRPANDYKLEIEVTRLTLNEAIPAERFVLQQPKGTELVNAGEEPQPAKAPEKNP